MEAFQRGGAMRLSVNRELNTALHCLFMVAMKFTGYTEATNELVH